MGFPILGNPPEKPPVLHFSLGFSITIQLYPASCGYHHDYGNPRKTQIIQCRAGDFRSPEGSTMFLLKKNGANSSMVLKLKKIRVQSQHQAHTHKLSLAELFIKSWSELHRFRTEWAMARWQLQDITDGKNDFYRFLMTRTCVLLCV